MKRRPRRSTLFPDTTPFRSMLDRALETGRAPALQAIRERGHYVADCVAAFPSVTPVCAASIATGEPPDRSMPRRSEEHTSELQSRQYLVCRLLLEKTHNVVY